MRSTLPGPLVCSESVTDDFRAVFLKRSTETNSSGRRALKIAVTLVPLSFAALASGASVARPAPRPTATMCRHLESSVKPVPSGPMMSRWSPGLVKSSPRVPAPVTLYRNSTWCVAGSAP